MRKLWNHYDPLDIDDDVDGQPLAPHEGPVPARTPVPGKKKLMQRLQDWLFHVEEEEGMEPARTLSNMLWSGSSSASIISLEPTTMACGRPEMRLRPLTSINTCSLRG